MKKLITIIVAVLGIAAIAQAQEPQSGYFLGNYIYRFRQNPSFRPEKNFISFPALGNLNTSAKTNTGFKSYIYQKDGKLVNFMHPSVTDSEFSNNLPDINKVGFYEDITLVAAGFGRGRFYHTIDVTFKSTGGISVPKELFEFLKYGNSYQDAYSIPNTSANLDSYVELAYGLNTDINEMVSVGGRIKALIGVASAKVKINNLYIDMSGDSWTVKAEGEVHGNVLGAKVPTEPNSDIYDFGEIDFDHKSFNPAGYGAAIDLGVTVTPSPIIKLSASITDLGGITWNDDVYGVINSDETVIEYSDKMEENLEELYKFHMKEASSSFRMLPATFSLGAEYMMMPKLTFGFLGAYHTGNINWFEARGALNASLGILDASICAGVSEFGINCGAMAALDFGPINLFIAGESATTKLAKDYYVPLNKCNLSVAFGLNITW